MFSGSRIAEKIILSLLCVVLTGGIEYWLLKSRHKEMNPDEKLLAWLYGLMPIAYGGYYTISSVLFGAVVLYRLVKLSRAKGLKLYINLSSIAIFAVVLFYGLSVFWAANHGMALYGFTKLFPLILFALLIMQLEPTHAASLYCMTPVSGVLLVIYAFLLMSLPGFVESQTAPAGQLAGFFEYPNTLATYLLVGIAIVFIPKERKKTAYLMALILVAGLLLTRSRIAFGVFAVEVIILCLYSGRKLYRILIPAICMLGAGVILWKGLLTWERIYNMFYSGSSTLALRFLYYRDALPEILRHPFGQGFWGYAARLKAFQHADYVVTYVHSDPLQLLFEIGWLPTIAFYLALGKSFFSKKATACQRLVLFILVSHGVFEFHLEYLVMWLLLLAGLQLHEGRLVQLRFRLPVTAVISLLLLSSLWLGIGEVCYVCGFMGLSGIITPVYTPALVARMSSATNLQELAQLTELYLKLEPESPVAYDAIANLAYAEGDISTMMQYKELAIAGRKYDIEEYTDYFDKLYEAMLNYAKAGDTFSAEMCRVKILSISDLMKEVRDSTDAMLQPSLYYPDEYYAKLEQLK